MKAILQAVFDFLLALIEALLKCFLAFSIMFVAVYPLIAVGQGKEAMLAMFDLRPGNMSWLFTGLTLSWACLLTFAFLHFLLGAWNYRARNGARSFCRIWLPGVFALCLALLYPISAEMRPGGSLLLDAMFGFVNASLVVGAVMVTWWWTRPVIAPKVGWFLIASGIVLFIAWLSGRLLVFYGLCLIALTVFCALIESDFRDHGLSRHPSPQAMFYGLSVALLCVLVGLWLSTSQVLTRMLLGAPGSVLAGFSFLLAVAYLLSALLSRVSAVLVRLAWLGLAAILVLSPIGREPLRVLDQEALPKVRLPPSQHFSAWLQSRKGEIKDGVEYPVIFVAAEGGGVRAAYWTATLLAALEERYPGFTKHVYAISGVSGGSVGAAVFDAMYREFLTRRDNRCAPLAEQRVQGLRPCTAYVFEWDILAPPVAALLLNDIPFGWHGRRRALDLEEGLEYAWFATTESRSLEQPLHSLWRDHSYDIPALVLNSTSAADGRRIVTSNLKATGELTDEPDVEEQLHRPLRLSTAAFVSARFPVLSPEATHTLADESPPRLLRLVDGGYFNNAGTASITSLLRVVLPKIREYEFSGKLKPMVLVLSSGINTPSQQGRFDGSLADAVIEPAAILAETSAAHEATYLREIRELISESSVFHMQPPPDSKKVALGWLLSGATRCEMDVMVNNIVNRSAESQALAAALRATDPGPATWQSCAAEDGASRPMQ